MPEINMKCASTFYYRVSRYYIYVVIRHHQIRQYVRRTPSTKRESPSYSRPSMTCIAMKTFSPFGLRVYMRSSTSPCLISLKKEPLWASLTAAELLFRFSSYRTIRDTYEGSTKRYHCSIDIDIVIGRTVVTACHVSCNSVKLAKLPPTAFRRITVLCFVSGPPSCTSGTSILFQRRG